MKININLYGKEIITPIFNISYNDQKNKFAILIKPNKEKISSIKGQIDEPSTAIGIKGTTIIFETTTSFYLFDFKNNFNIFPQNTDFDLCLAFIDQDDKIIQMEYKYFIINVNENKN